MNSWLDKPTVDYCEKAISGLIARPGYGISNFAYILVGIFIILRNRKSRFSWVFGSLSVFIGICSFSYDASFTYLSQYIDWLGMFLFILFLLLLNLKRLFNIKKSMLFIYGVILLIIYLVFSLITQQGVLFFGLGVAFVAFSEIYLFFKKKAKLELKWLAALVLFLVGFVARNLDLYKVICDPSNLFNGRGIFHYLGAVSVLLLHSYYKKIKLNLE